MIRIVLPYQLRLLAQVDGEIALEVEEQASARALLDALEARFPALEGTIRDHSTQARRAYLRYFACGQDISFVDMDEPLPQAVQRGEEPFHVIGAISGG